MRREVDGEASCWVAEGPGRRLAAGGTDFAGRDLSAVRQDALKRLKEVALALVEKKEVGATRQLYAQMAAGKRRDLLVGDIETAIGDAARAAGAWGEAAHAYCLVTSAVGATHQQKSTARTRLQEVTVKAAQPPAPAPAAPGGAQ